VVTAVLNLKFVIAGELPVFMIFEWYIYTLF